MHLLVHISDVHLGAGAEPKPVETVVAAVRGLGGGPCTATIVLTGDIAHSGKAEQYEAARRYFASLQGALENQVGSACQIVACPGNHDADFSEDTAVRDVVIEKIRSSGALPQSSDMIRHCIDVHAAFFSWVESLGVASPEGDELRLAWAVEDQMADGSRIEFRVLNTAWMSTLSEAQGSLFFPPSLVSDLPRADVRVSVFHHPYNWFEASNGRDLRRTLEANSDIVLTGHEHDFDAYTVSRSADDQSGYVEGGAFAGPRDERSSFNVIQIDTDKSRYRVVPFDWDGASFMSRPNTLEWLPYVCRTGSAASEQNLSDEMARFLTDPGLQLTHPAKALILEDIFVPPDLRTYEQSGQLRSEGSGIIRSENCINRLFEDGHAYLLGDSQCGKTSLAKVLYLHALRQKRTPVLLTGEQIRQTGEKHLRKLVDAELGNQHKGMSTEAFWQLERDSKVLIIDDFTATRLNAKGKDEVAEVLKRDFGNVFLFGGDLTQVEDLIAGRGEDGGLVGFRRYEIRPFGYLLRDLLIEKWITLGREHEIREDVLQQRLRETANIVDRVLGNNLIPSSPVYLLILLQQLEAQVPLDTRSGSYGYFYEALVTIALQRSSRSPEGVDAKYTYLSELAWRLFPQDRAEMDSESLDSFTRDHLEQFRLNRSLEEFKGEVLDSRLLQFTYGKCHFAHRYSLYYFVARYMRDNSEEDDVQACLRQAVDQIHREDFANVLIFYTYLTRSKPLVRLVLDKARSLFGTVEPCNMDDHVSFIGRLQARALDVVLPDVDAREERRAVLRKRDELEPHTASAHEPHPEEQEPTDEDELNLALSMNSAIKTLQVLGQILRNFSGSLRKDLKQEITRECFDLALRVLNGFYRSLERHLDATLVTLADLLGKDLMGLPERQREDAANKIIFILTELMCLGTLRRISYAVGSEALVRTYEDVEQVYDNRAARFVQLCLRLDHCGQFPRQRVLTLYDEVEKDGFGVTLLRILVAEHFHQFNRPYRVRQSISSKIGLRYRPALPKPKTSLPLPESKGR